MKLALIIPAAGSGERLGAGIPKAFVTAGGATLLEYAIRPFLPLPELSAIAVAVPESRLQETAALLEKLAPDVQRVVITGGARRQDSVRNAVLACGETDLVAIHDAARPFTQTAAIRKCLEAAGTTGAALLAVPATDTVKFATPETTVSSTLERSRVWMAQTPQIFDRKNYLHALEQAGTADSFTDDASLMEASGFPVQLVEGHRDNIKITWPEDLQKLNAMQQPPFRIGNGYDIHRLVEGRRLVLGGVEIPFEMGLDGHSDADVVLHAIMDALLGALALADIGTHFPNTDPAWKGADSRVLLRAVYAMVKERGYRAANIDAMVIAEKPKLMPHIPVMRERIAADLELPLDCVSVKATTSEKIGHIGRMEGIETHASALLIRTP